MAPMQGEPASRQRRPPGAVVARWLRADPRDVAFIDMARTGTARSVPSISAGVAGWQRSIGRRRAIALARRALIVGLAAACLLQLGALATGNGGPGPWLVPALLLVALCLVPGIAYRTSPAIAARMLDRDLGHGAEVATALELERGPSVDAAHGLARLVLSDGREALSRSLGGARARLRPRHRESLLLAALAAALVLFALLPALHRGAGITATTPDAAGHHPLALRGGNTDTNQPAGPDLRGYAQQRPPELGTGTSSTRRGGSTATNGRFGGAAATASHRAPGSVQPASRTVGNAGYLQSARTNSSKTSASSEGKAAGGKSALTTSEAPAATTVASLLSPSDGAHGQQAQGTSASAGVAGRLGSKGGAKRGGGGSSAAGRNDSRAAGPRQSTPGGATAGAAHGAQSDATGVVPQLAGDRTLPIQPGYEAVKGTKGARGEGATSANGAGGASHSGRAATSASRARGAGVAYVPPGGSSVAPVDRRLLIGYFGSYARVAAAGW
jgi:hypothetical protein